MHHNRPGAAHQRKGAPAPRLAQHRVHAKIARTERHVRPGPASTGNSTQYNTIHAIGHNTEPTTEHNIEYETQYGTKLAVQWIPRFKSAP